MEERAERRERGKTLEKLFVTFARIGLFTFGGGYAMIPLIQREAAEKNRWISEHDLLDITAIAESTPGPIAVNAATFVGQKVAGVAGAACATLGVVLPSFLILLVLSWIPDAFRQLEPVRYAFVGIRACVLALLVRAAITLGRQCPKNRFAYAVMAAAFGLSLFTGVRVILLILGSALLGLGVTLLSHRKDDGK